MGLDTVELVMRIEEEFGIDLPDKDLESIVRMGQMRDYLEKRLRMREQTHCPSQRAFYRLRRALMEVGGFQRDEVRPHSQVHRYLARDKRAFWNRLSEQINCRLPDLVLHPRICRGGVVLLGCALVATSLFTSVRHPALASGAVGIVLAAGVVVLTIFYYVLRKIPKLLTVPAGVGTIGQLSDYIGRRLYSNARQDTSAAVWDRLCRLTADQAGVDVEELTPETHFINDLFPAG